MTVKNGANMKRIMILAFILILSLVLGACSTKPNANPNIPNTGIHLTQTPLPAASVNEPNPLVSPTLSSGDEAPSEQPTQTPTQSIPTPEPSSTEQSRNGVPGTINKSVLWARLTRRV